MLTNFGKFLGHKLNGTCNSMNCYHKSLLELERYGRENFLQELREIGIIAGNKISSNNNFFLKVVKSEIDYPNLLAMANMSHYSDSYCIVNNLPEHDKNYLSPNTECSNKVSMSRFHKFICPKTDDPTYMNAIMFQSNTEIIKKLQAMETIAREFAGKHGVTNVGLYVHCFPLNSIQLLHIHILDLDHVGRGFEYNNHKNLKLCDVISVLLDMRA